MEIDLESERRPRPPNPNPEPRRRSSIVEYPYNSQRAKFRLDCRARYARATSNLEVATCARYETHLQHPQSSTAPLQHAAAATSKKKEEDATTTTDGDAPPVATAAPVSSAEISVSVVAAVGFVCRPPPCQRLEKPSDSTAPSDSM